MNISGVVVRSRPEFSDQAVRSLTQLEGVEVHAVGDDGRMVVTIESDADGAMTESVIKMHDLPHVLSVSMIYHHFDDDNEGDLS